MIQGHGAEPDLLAELATLGSLVAAAGRARTSGETASSALAILKRSTAADAGVVLYDAGRGFNVEAEFGFGPGIVARLVADRSVSTQLASALDASRTVVFGPIDRLPLDPSIAAGIAANGLRFVLAAPLRASGRLVGVLGLAWRNDVANPPSEVAIQHASTVIGTSLENAHLVAELERTIAAARRLADEESALHTLTLVAETAGAFDELAATTVRDIVGLLGAAAGSYALLTDDDRVLHSASVGIDREFIETAIGVPASSMRSLRRLLDGQGPYIQAFVKGSVTPVAFEQAHARGWTHFAMLPITVRDRLRAAIVLLFDHAPDLPEPERSLGGIARIASISLSNFQLRERLQASETRYRVLFEESPDAIVLLSTANEVIDANPAALRLYRTDLPGLRTFLTSGAPLIADAERARRAEIVRRDGRGTFRDTGVRPDGTTFPEEVGIVRVEIGGESRHLLIVRDLTEQEHLQGELLQAQKMEAIGQLVSGVAHELNNPLAAIIAFSQLIRGDARLPEDMRRDAELLVQESDRTRRIVQNLLDFARQRPPERHPTPLAALVESVLALQSYSIAAGRIALVVDVPRDLPRVDIDRSQFQQVILNLTLNAIQAIRGDPGERNGGHIWITARSVESAQSPTIRLTVADDGPGIPEHVRSRLFLPFFTTKRPGEGTGLGLSVSFGIVASHGGTLHFEPRPGGGSMFVLDIPVGADGAGTAPDDATAPGDAMAPDRVAAADVGAANAGSSATSRKEPGSTAPRAAGSTSRPRAPRTIAPASPDGSRPRVLVLDDEPSIRAFLTKALRLAGLEAVPVAAGEEAIERCRAEGFAAVLVDHRMPGLSGTEVFEEVVRIRPELASRFVFMSGDVLNPDLREFAAAHSAFLLAKPFDVETVNSIVSDVVARSRGSADRARGEPA